MNNGNVQIALLLLTPLTAFAVSPLTTDDADTVEPGRLQLNAGYQFSRTDSASLCILPVNPVFGLCSRGELGATFGYQWSHAPGQTDADGITDLTLGTKWRLWPTPDEKFKFAARLDLKLPTASRDRGLGTGNVDLGGVLIGTRCWGSTSLDWNLGYAANDASRSVFGDDHFFVGQAVRQELTKRWTLIGEAYAIIPLTKSGGATNIHFDGGAQFSVDENFLVSLLVGSAAGCDSADLTGYLGFTWVF